VGRGGSESYCILISDADDGTDRLQTFVRTEDGFQIARADLRLRGMGDFFGARQHGLPDFRFFDPERDEELLVRAREDARGLVASDPELEAHPAYRAVLEARYRERERLYEVG
jgi:ATP-dependent DNA helicase RecG